MSPSTSTISTRTAAEHMLAVNEYRIARAMGGMRGGRFGTL
jgi:hypothetical protein